MYSFTELDLTVWPGDIIGAYQPDIAMSKTSFRLRDNALTSSYFITDRRRSLKWFDFNQDDVEHVNRIPILSVDISGTYMVKDAKITLIGVKSALYKKVFVLLIYVLTSARPIGLYNITPVYSSCLYNEPF